MIRRLAWLLGLILVLTPSCSPTPDAPAATPTEGMTASPLSTSAPTATTFLSAEPEPRDVHPADGAGQWYPAAPEKLRTAVDDYLDQAEVEPLPGRLVAVIVPHAGYLYSGAVASHAFRVLQLADCADRTIAVIGDTHTGSGSAPIAVWAAGTFETPLGSISVDERIAQGIVDAEPRIEFDRTAFENEHPVENQLPFLQTVCPGARIVPVVIRQPSQENSQLLAEALVAAFGDEPGLIVASTDLSHYYPYNMARQIDEVALQAIVSLDPQAVVASPRRCTELGLADQPLTMCSQGAVLTAMIAGRQWGANRATVLHYANSGDTPVGERDAVVGYGAVALWRDQVGQGAAGSFALPRTSEPVESISLTADVQEELLALARQTAAHFLAFETFPRFQTDDPALLQLLGAYVTYEQDDALRGCLGRLVGDRPVYLNVQYAAVAAAVADRRFPPITPQELETLSIEITVLHPLRQVEEPQELQIGREGVLLRVSDQQRALYLPQVPVEQGWDLAATLLNLCRKAELADDCWQRDDARFYVFGGQWFGEHE